MIVLADTNARGELEVVAEVFGPDPRFFASEAQHQQATRAWLERVKTIAERCDLVFGRVIPVEGESDDDVPA